MSFFSCCFFGSGGKWPPGEGMVLQVGESAAADMRSAGGPPSILVLGLASGLGRYCGLLFRPLMQKLKRKNSYVCGPEKKT